MPVLDPASASPTAAHIYGVAIIVAPLLLLSSTIAYVTVGNGINDGVVGGTIGVWSCFALAIAFVGILRLAEPEAPRAAPLLAVLAQIAFCAGVAFNVQAIVTGYFGADTTFIDVVEGSDAFGVLAFLPWGLFTPVALVGTGLLLWRTRTAAPWIAALLVIGGVGFVTSRPARVDVLAVITDGALVVALVPLGWTILTRTRTPERSSGVSVPEHGTNTPETF